MGSVSLGGPVLIGGGMVVFGREKSRKNNINKEKNCKGKDFWKKLSDKFGGMKRKA